MPSTTKNALVHCGQVFSQSGNISVMVLYSMKTEQFGQHPMQMEEETESALSHYVSESIASKGSLGEGNGQKQCNAQRQCLAMSQALMFRYHRSIMALRVRLSIFPDPLKASMRISLLIRLWSLVIGNAQYCAEQSQ
jgi:hypothetical protein